MTRVEHSGFPQRQVCAIRAALSTCIVLTAMSGCSWSPDPPWPCRCLPRALPCCPCFWPTARVSWKSGSCDQEWTFRSWKEHELRVGVVWGPSSPYWGPLGIHSAEQSILPPGICMAVGMWQCPVFILLVHPPWDIQHFRKHAQAPPPCRMSIWWNADQSKGHVSGHIPKIDSRVQLRASTCLPRRGSSICNEAKASLVKGARGLIIFIV